MDKTKKRRIQILAASVFWLGIWQAAAAAIGQEVFLVSPVQAIGTLVELLPQAEFWQRIGFSAGRILLSRSQLATQAQRESAIDHLKRALAACKCSRTLTEEDFLIKDWADLEDADLAALDDCGYQHADCEKLCFDAHDAFGSAYFLELGLPRQQLEARIPSLFTDAACGRVLRVKGFVQDAAGWVELNATADGLTAAPIPAGQEVLIVIGEGLDKERIEAVLRN